MDETGGVDQYYPDLSLLIMYSFMEILCGQQYYTTKDSSTTTLRVELGSGSTRKTRVTETLEEGLYSPVERGDES